MDAATILAVIGILLGGGGLFTVIAQQFGKRIKTPADRQAEIEYGTRVLQSIIEQQNKDKAANDEVIGTLRKYVEKLETDSRDDQEMITTLQRQIRKLEDLNHEKDRLIESLRQRQIKVAAKIRNQEPIVIQDIFGDDEMEEAR